MLGKFRAAWRRRALPIGIRSLRSCQVSYSQFGEDLLVDAVFGPKYSGGRYVDVGCFDPQKWSNIYRFYLKGWSGICIDPNIEFRKLWNAQRPRDIFLNLAVSAEAGQALYETSTRFPQENHLIAASPQDKGEFAAQVVATERLDRILNNHHPTELPIDLMSVDCEGHDLEVLQSNDFERFRPRVLLVEDHKRLERSEIDEFCESHEYQLLTISSISKLFCDSRWLLQRKREPAKRNRVVSTNLSATDS